MELKTPPSCGLLITRFPLRCGWGGEEKLHADLAKALMASGSRVVFLTSDPALIKGLRRDSIPVRRVAIVKDLTAIRSIWCWPVWIVSLFIQAIVALPVYRARGYRVILMLTLIEKVLLSPLALLCGYRLVWGHHAPLGRWFFCNPFLGFWRLWGRKAQIIVPSMYMKQSFGSLATGLDITVIPNPVDATPGPGPLDLDKRFGIPPRGLLIGTAARLSPEKNLPAFLGLAKRFPEHTFLIAGDGPEQSTLARAITAQKLTNCHLLGHLDGADLKAWYQSLDLFCLLSSKETFGLAAGEASAQGVAVIAAKGSGTSEVIADRVSGLLYDPDRPHDAATKLAFLARSPELRQQMGEAGQKRMGAFGFGAYFQRMSGVLAQGKKV